LVVAAQLPAAVEEPIKMKPPRTATVVLPAYGVEDAIGSVVRDLAVAAYALRARGIDLDVLLLDGGKHTAVASDVATELGLTLTSVPGPPSGPGEAFLEGLREVAESGRADLVVTLDANGRHDPTQIPSLIDHLILRNSHVIIGSRWTSGSGTPGLSFSRWLLGRTANLTFRLVTNTPKIGDATTSFRVARTDIIPELDLSRMPIDTYGVHTTFVAKAVVQGYRVGEAPIIYREPIAGGGGLALRDVGEFASHLFALREETRRVRQRRLSPAGPHHSWLGAHPLDHHREPRPWRAGNPALLPMGTRRFTTGRRQPRRCTDRRRA
jgi:hypothetical protein